MIDTTALIRHEQGTTGSVRSLRRSSLCGSADECTSKRVAHLIPYAGMLLRIGSKVQGILSDFGLEIGGHLIHTFSSIDDPLALYNWAKEDLLSSVLEESEIKLTRLCGCGSEPKSTALWRNRRAIPSTTSSLSS